MEKKKPKFDEAAVKKLNAEKQKAVSDNKLVKK